MKKIILFGIIVGLLTISVGTAMAAKKSTLFDGRSGLECTILLTGDGGWNRWCYASKDYAIFKIGHYYQGILKPVAKIDEPSDWDGVWRSRDPWPYAGQLFYYKWHEIKGLSGK